MRTKRLVPGWASQVMAVLSAGEPVPTRRLAESVAAAPTTVAQFLAGEPRAVLTGEGWVDGLLLAEGMAVLHELSEVEAETGVLAADVELALFAQLASAGLPLAGDGSGIAQSGAGGVVQARGLPELPPRLRDSDLQAGRGLIGLALVGPPGWFDGFAAGDLLAVRLVGGALEVTAAPSSPAGEPGSAAGSARAGAVVAACTEAASDAVERFRDGEGEQPAAAVPGVLARLLVCSSRGGSCSMVRCRRWGGGCGWPGWRRSAGTWGCGVWRGIGAGFAG